ncbi:transcription/translation regulatory transformer protein RfaH [Erythrobacter sp. SCSIO 43205]|uniref:transcription termination/antitermination protein NusG n=1 Tax=Erythrobacter sp. SCSIO 43205 TaxID=2779361 RepID=UPI001CA8233E|nr:transcription termination/antitermination NusG family protein [Erythrobacter sp. SCSIO 43205]UAB78966.1 transcription/translation regulatory transformer protein RfaH [Erythrobacter sp. SCSIO 43205]
MSNWLVAQTKPHATMLAVNNLHRQGFTTFLPLERRMQRRQNRLQEMTKPYFGNYLFVSLRNSEAPVSQIRSTCGVSRLVEFGGSIAKISERLIDELKSRCDENGFLQLQSNTQVGDKVRVAGGPFYDHLGKVEQLASNDRVWVLLDILGHRNRTLVAKSDLVEA